MSISGSNDIYQAGYKIIQVPVLGEGAHRTPTFYASTVIGLVGTCVPYVSRARRLRPSSGQSEVIETSLRLQ